VRDEDLRQRIRGHLVTDRAEPRRHVDAVPVLHELVAERLERQDEQRHTA